MKIEYKVTVDESKIESSRLTRNPIAAGFRQQFQDSFRYVILPNPVEEGYTFEKADANLYLSDRPWRGPQEFEASDPDQPYESYLQELFWTPEQEKRFHKDLVFLVGEKGIGKSTLLDYYLRSFCPNDPEKNDAYRKKLVINVNLHGVQSEAEFNDRFYQNARDQILLRAESFGIDSMSLGLDNKVRDASDYKTQVEQALARISKLLENNSKLTKNIEYIVLCLDNIDQSPQSIQELAIRLVTDWMSPQREINVWQTFIPLWPNTLERLVANERIQIPYERYIKVELGAISPRIFFQSRTADLIRHVALSGRSVDYTDATTKKEIRISSPKCVEYLSEAAEVFDEHSMQIVSSITNGDLRISGRIFLNALSSDVLYWFKEKGHYRLGNYRTIDAILTGAYRLHHRQKNEIANLFHLTEEINDCQDVLIGLHLLQELSKRREGKYVTLQQCLIARGHDEIKIRQAYLELSRRNIFERFGSGIDSAFSVHQAVANGYWRLLKEPAYLDNMAIVSPVRKKLPEDIYKVVETDSFHMADFPKRVLSTISFLHSLKADEEEFGSSEHFSFLWPSMAASYKERLEILKEQGRNEEARGINESWWVRILADPIFARES